MVFVAPWLPPNVLNFSDLMILSMAFTNMLALYLLQGKVKAALDEYTTRFKSGQFEKEPKS